ncbi:MAG: DUF480 domain-containing protein [Kiritimatiellales bacterium]|nr:DUF480 domain-containing protein [Kiritimatiellales bacterium]
MDVEMNAIEVRVLGCLIEKETATPDHYPLTLNALVNACNQKSNREPEMLLDERSVVRALDELRMKHQLAVQVTSTESRVPKYKHNILSTWEFTPAETAVLCELFVRGPQTPGDLRSRASRLHAFAERSEVETILQDLQERDDGPFVIKLPREAGKREPRWAHLFSGEVEISNEEPEARPEPARLAVQAEDARIQVLEEEVAALRQELDELKSSFTEFKTAFE